VGLTVLDAGVVIALLDAADAHHAAAVAALRIARDRGDVLVLPASAYAECLVSPQRRGPDAVAVVDRFLDALPVRVEPADRTIAAAAAALRATHGTALRLPDGLVIATAIVLGADRILTTDAGWPAVPIPVEVLAAA
jgi:predicted nucleic acid-binding protein